MSVSSKKAIRKPGFNTFLGLTYNFKNCAHHKRDSVEKKPTSSLVTLGNALTAYHHFDRRDRAESVSSYAKNNIMNVHPKKELFPN